MKRAPGLTLVEVLVAIAVVGVIVAVVSPLLITSMSGNASSRERTRAIGAAETWLDRYRALREPFPTTGSATYTYGYGFDFATDGVSAHSTDAAALNTQMQKYRSVIDVTRVSTGTSAVLWEIRANVWFRQGGEQHVELSTRVT
ncbi:prepilin-type N-terminal cleavage/methylation domain-containing protein [Deinococcus pimensis]|uniref:prepilin-type N-terminal cleavage/methylation domain-containing protein n=1 Tax=Deinococcus pimensis TaxID=309888 RepID=UPI0004BCDCB7|nr:prepilin-type N-terminal cleavage/methylation domain-containing protein [Deinococcus pimensis]